MVAVILEVLVEVIVAAPDPETRLPSMKASVLVRIMFVASAPAPLRATPASGLNAAASAAATLVTLIVAFSVAVRLIAPAAVTP